jgi:dolichol-phosphate mannosyltransferase
MVVVDDNSQDGTATLLRQFGRRYPLKAVIRKDEKGLSGAVIEGFRQAKGDYFIVMDADLSHPPELLPSIIKAIKNGAQVVLPSRYMRGGGVEKWPWDRRIISLGATGMAKLLTQASDPMSGYFAIRKDVIKGVNLNPIGYKILLEILVKGSFDKRKTVQIPYIFQNRFKGASKLNAKIYLEYVKQLFMLYLYKLTSFFRSPSR